MKSMKKVQYSLYTFAHFMYVLFRMIRHIFSVTSCASYVVIQ